MTIAASTGIFRRLPIPRAFLQDLITIEAMSSTSDGQGGQLDVWTALAGATGIRAIVVDVPGPGGPGGAETTSIGQNASHVTHQIWIRQDVVGLDPRCRVAYKSKHYRIHDVVRYGGNSMITAEEVR